VLPPTMQGDELLSEPLIYTCPYLARGCKFQTSSMDDFVLHTKWTWPELIKLDEKGSCDVDLHSGGFDLATGQKSLGSYLLEAMRPCLCFDYSLRRDVKKTLCTCCRKERLL